MRTSLVVVTRPMLLVMMVIGTLLLISIAASSPGAGSVAAQGPEPQAPRVALGTGFTYQGQLKKNNAPVNGTCGMTFSLWDSQFNGTGQIGSIQSLPGVPVTNGLFTVLLNGGNQFGLSAFDGSDRWLQTAVQCAGDGSAVTLSRQPLSVAPMRSFQPRRG